ncbi:MAG: flagellar biosynthesis protein FliQ [bacterium]
MSQQLAIDIGREMLMVAILLSAPLLGASLIMGVIISIFQAVTQIQEMTLTFIPKIAAITIVLIILMPWMLNIIVNFTVNLLVSLPNYAH